MITLSKEKVQDKIIEISMMNKRELINFACALSLMDIDDVSRDFLNRALDLSLSNLMGIDTTGLVVCSEMKADEIGLE